MQIDTLTYNGRKIAYIAAHEKVLTNEDSAAQLISTVKFGKGINDIVIAKNLAADVLFNPESEASQSVFNRFKIFRMRIAIYGDFSKNTDKPFINFMHECNNGRNIFFTDTLQQALQKLSATI